MKNFTVKTGGPLLETLFDQIGSSMSRTAVRRLLAHRRVLVNDAPARHDHVLREGDRVSFLGRGTPGPEYGLHILYEDEHVAVIDKPHGLLSVATETERERTAYRALNTVLRARDERAFIVHRLDREVSGLLVLAKTERDKRMLQAKWPDVIKRYYALVEGVPDPPEGVLEEELLEAATGRVSRVERGRKGFFSVTRFETLEKGRKRALLRVTIETGRKHQIRVQLANIGHPIAGDETYGRGGNPIGRLGLHAYFLDFPHPARRERMVFETPLPEVFRKGL